MKVNDTILKINNIEKNYAAGEDSEKVHVLNSLSFSVKKGEIVSIVGPSGCGKSTLLNIVAGFEKTDGGEVYYNNTRVFGPNSEIAVVFQAPELFLWLTVSENIAFGLNIKKEDKQVIKDKVSDFIKLVNLEGFEKFYPNQLSIGMQQRVALARALILSPNMLIMDEPFSALDYQTRIMMQKLLLKLWDKFKMTILFVTHDVEEAIFLADKTIVLSKRPAKIIDEIIVPFERPRQISIIADNEFLKLKSRVLGYLM